MKTTERKPIIRRVGRAVDWEAAGRRTPLDFIVPDALEMRHRDYIVSGRTYMRHLAVVGFPPSVRFGHLTRLFSGQPGVNVLQVVDPLSEGDSRRYLGRSRRTARVTLMDTEDAAQAEAGLQDIERLRLRVARGQERLVRYGIYIQVAAPDLEELDTRTEAVEAQVHALGLQTIRCSFRQKQAFDAFIPGTPDTLSVLNLVDSSTAAHGFFFASSSIAPPAEGCPTFFGVAVDRSGGTAGPVLFDGFDRSFTNPHLAVLATTGGGKSYLLKYMLIQDLLWGRRFFIIDPEHEYQALAEALGGAFIRIAPGSPHRINPFDLPHFAVLPDEEERDILSEKTVHLAGLLEKVLSPHRALSTVERGRLEQAVLAAYASAGVTPENAPRFRGEVPTLSDLLPYLAEALPELAPALERMTGGVLQMFNGQTNVPLDAPLVVFGFRDLDTEELQNLAAEIAFERIWTYARSRPKPEEDPTTLLLDEAWVLVQSPVGGRMLDTTIRRGRKYFLRVGVATQKVEDVVSSPIGRTLINNCFVKVLLQMEPGEARLTAESFNLTPGELDYLLGCERTERYSDCLLILGKRRMGLRVLKAPAGIHRLLTARPGM